MGSPCSAVGLLSKVCALLSAVLAVVVTVVAMELIQLIWYIGMFNGSAACLLCALLVFIYSFFLCVFTCFLLVLINI